MRMRMALVPLVLASFISSPAFAAPRQMVDFYRGATAVVWKGDGSELAIQDGGGIAVRDAHTLRLLRYLPLKTRFQLIVDRYGSSPILRAWSGDNLVVEDIPETQYEGQTVVSSALILSAQTGQTKTRLPGVVFSSGNQSLWYHRGSRFRVFSLEENRWFNANLPLRTQKGSGTSFLPDITFSGNGRFAAEQLNDGRMRLWNVRTRKVITILSDKASYIKGAWPTVRSRSRERDGDTPFRDRGGVESYAQVEPPLVWSPDGKRIATLGESPPRRVSNANKAEEEWGALSVKIWDSQSGKLLQRFSPYSTAQILTWSGNETLVVGGEWSFETRRLGQKKSAIFGDRFFLSLSPDRRHLFANNDLMKFDKSGQVQVVNSLLSYPPGIRNLAWSYDGRYLAAGYGAQDRKRNDWSGLQIWNVSSFALENAESSNSPLHIGWTQDNRAWSSDFYRITSWKEDKTWKKSDWLAPFIDQRPSPSTNATRANGLFLLPDGERRIQLQDLGGTGIYELEGADAPPSLLFKNAQSGGFREVISPDGKWLCFYLSVPDETVKPVDGISELSSYKLILRAYELRAGGRTLEIKHAFKNSGQNYDSSDLTPRFSPDSQFLAWGGRIYQWPSGEVVGDTHDTKGGVALAISPNAEKVLRVGGNGVRLFNRQGDVLATLPIKAHPEQAQFSPDGEHIALSLGQAVEIYDVASAQLEATLYAWPSNSLTPTTEWLVLRPDGSVQGTPGARKWVIPAPEIGSK